MDSWPLADLDKIGSLAAIGAFVITAIGAIVGVYGYCSYKCEFRRKRLALENYLADEKQKAQGSSVHGQKSLLNIIRYVGLTEDEILKISFVSDKIDRKLSRNEADGFADRVLLWYVGDE